ncbi:MAG TPA: GNAT family N-acetyltransferase [Verrucomicrobiae bacterium]|nr:GNAT family N-acetyltransferase [Verrucomicrobiae bacterium]
MSDTAADGHVLQVNVSPGGVPKHPVDRAWVGRLGLDGDAHQHHTVHGGPHRAVALFAMEAIERVQADGHPIEPGSVGENLTTAGIELARLEAGTRLAVGETLLLELSGPANPCDVIKGAFRAGKSGRISILTHPDDTRMYARVLAEGEVRPGDAIRVLPPAPSSMARTLQLLDLLESVDREAWLGLWRAAAEAGFDVRVLELGDAAGAASPDLPGVTMNRAFGLRQVPIVLPELVSFYQDAGTTGWLITDADAPPFPGAVAEDPTGIHAGPIEDVPDAEVAGLEIRAIEPDEATRWAELFVTGFAIEGPLADAWLRFNPILARTRGYVQLIARLDGRDVGAAAIFARRRVAWLGGMTVLQEARGRGIQRALIAARARRAEALGCRRILATADVDGVSAANLEAMGVPRIWTRAGYRVEPRPA